MTAANKALAMVIAASELDRLPVTHFEPTDLSGLSELAQRGSSTAREDTQQANRMRAASHLYLVAARHAMAAALDLGKVSMEMTTAEREAMLHAIGAQSTAAGHCATQASRILTGEIDPPVDDSVVVSKLTS
ncbi:hypothetical protein [Variovorax sp. N23]|uniref:hypothetical protein n=1 Tax=Variovorax sp. N23 TaxID=2980555 RepID=UPI0021C71B21|nr:hypothetical protein [Variovorax sp. N23]MCU4122294.1 hypothetical protein [Variovorax sp. N23]